jgi:hypothetical protein
MSTGGSARIHGQLALSNLSASREDILLMRKHIATAFEYYFSAG